MPLLWGRVEEGEQELIRKAAALDGRSISSFVRKACLERAKKLDIENGN